MSSLRRDLIDRKMWVIVALLIVAVVAVPVLLMNGGSADGAAAAPPPPPATPARATGEPASTSVKSTTTHHRSTKVAMAHLTRDPFSSPSGASGASTASTATTTSTASASPPVSSATSTASASPASATAAAMVTPSPSVSTASASANSAPSTPASTATTPSHAASSAPVSTTASVTPPPAAKAKSWTLYSVSVRYGKDLSVRLRSNLMRLTALPSAANPQAMFLGVMTGGAKVVFALKAGVGHTGPGLCRPDHSRCSAILLGAGQTEHLTIPVTGAAPKPVLLRVVRVRHTVTHSRLVALAAYLRYSHAGLCDLALADPVFYNLGTGTVSGVPKAVCDHQPKSVPFTPLVTTP